MKVSRSSPSISEVGSGVFFVQGPASNWVILRGPNDVSLIDAGYPGDLPAVEDSLEVVAEGLPLRNILVTHGHSDHIGSIPELIERNDVDVWAAVEEIPNIRRDVLHQVSFKDVLPRLYKPRYLSWTIHAVRAGGLKTLRIPRVKALRPDAVVRFSAHDVVPRLTPGHTPGHLVFDLPADDIVVTGDAVITAHRTVAVRGLQALSSIWHWDPVMAESVAGRYLHESRTVLPGHGPAQLSADKR